MLPLRKLPFHSSEIVDMSSTISSPTLPSVSVMPVGGGNGEVMRVGLVVRVQLYEFVSLPGITRYLTCLTILHRLLSLVPLLLVSDTVHHPFMSPCVIRSNFRWLPGGGDRSVAVEIVVTMRLGLNVACLRPQ